MYFSVEGSHADLYYIQYSSTQTLILCTFPDFTKQLDRKTKRNIPPLQHMRNYSLSRTKTAGRAVSKQSEISPFFKTKGVNNFRQRLTLHRISYIVCHAKITQFLLNNHSAQKLSVTFMYPNFLTNVLKIIKDPL